MTVRSRLRRFFAWLASPDESPNAHCPVCQREVRVAPFGYKFETSAPTKEELVSACRSQHGSRHGRGEVDEASA